MYGTILHQENLDQSIAERIGTGFEWPTDLRVADPTRVENQFAMAARLSGTNVIRPQVRTSDDGRLSISYYVLIGTRHSALFDELALTQGRWLSAEESRSADVFDASYMPPESMQVGTVEVPANAYDLKVATLRASFDSLPTTGKYFVEGNKVSVAKFFSSVNAQLAESALAGLAIAPKKFTNLVPSNSNAFAVLQIILWCVFAIALVATVLREGKRIGVMRLLGASTLRIVIHSLGVACLVGSVIGVSVAYAIVSALPGSTGQLLWGLTQALLETIVVGTCVVLVVEIPLVKRIRIDSLIKGRI